MLKNFSNPFVIFDGGNDFYVSSAHLFEALANEAKSMESLNYKQPCKCLSISTNWPLYFMLMVTPC